VSRLIAYTLKYFLGYGLIRLDRIEFDLHANPYHRPEEATAVEEKKKLFSGIDPENENPDYAVDAMVDKVEIDAVLPSGKMLPKTKKAIRQDGLPLLNLNVTAITYLHGMHRIAAVKQDRQLRILLENKYWWVIRFYSHSTYLRNIITRLSTS
jgi:hypothetical protein